MKECVAEGGAFQQVVYACGVIVVSNRSTLCDRLKYRHAQCRHWKFMSLWLCVCACKGLHWGVIVNSFCGSVEIYIILLLLLFVEVVDVQPRTQLHPIRITVNNNYQCFESISFITQTNIIKICLRLEEIYADCRLLSGTHRHGVTPYTKLHKLLKYNIERPEEFPRSVVCPRYNAR